MATEYKKLTGQKPAKEPVNKLDTLHETWTVMKPFVHFSAKAMKVIAHSLVFIVKNVPKPGEHEPAAKKSDKVIKI